MNRAYRLVAAGVLSVALVGASAATSMAAPVERPAAPVSPAPVPPTATLTAKASVNSVKAWEEFRISGTSTGLTAGTQVSVQQKQKSAWVTLPASVAVNKSGAYSLRVKLGIKGKNELRMAGGGVVSPVVTVTIL
ncbi:hypothetical protein NX801_26870 [Streptomyces sp. LP05-1]|uniref:Secreted protein n=1 Tax=Streptomyces pyxinae TaxID=2970734 RepID=A0ABT2CP43_9ACTN|nr:hypothetical protein [Streptomyces sp. LP05-1]MCS0639200.1 hypothetical protein [Streptomyces sp. LP05-1]